MFGLETDLVYSCSSDQGPRAQRIKLVNVAVTRHIKMALDWIWLRIFYKRDVQKRIARSRNEQLALLLRIFS